MVRWNVADMCCYVLICQVHFPNMSGPFNIVTFVGLTGVASGLDIKLSEYERSERDRLILIFRKLIIISFLLF